MIGVDIIIKKFSNHGVYEPPEEWFVAQIIEGCNLIEGIGETRGEALKNVLKNIGGVR